VLCDNFVDCLGNVFFNGIHVVTPLEPPVAKLERALRREQTAPTSPLPSSTSWRTHSYFRRGRAARRSAARPSPRPVLWQRHFPLELDLFTLRAATGGSTTTPLLLFLLAVALGKLPFSSLVAGVFPNVVEIAVSPSIWSENVVGEITLLDRSPPDTRTPCPGSSPASTCRRRCSLSGRCRRAFAP